MPAHYILIHVHCDDHLTDLLIAGMSVIGYDSFVNQDSGFDASILSGQYNEQHLKKLFQNHRSCGSIEYETEDLDEQNWNEIWEKNFEPVVVGENCIIKASFHAREKRYPLEIIINPKMSFGTGHHVTTRLMIENQLATDHKEKTVLDVGCGTGILSILAEKLGAREVTGIDIDPWAFENAHENLKENGARNVKIMKAEIGNLDEKRCFDIILANINRHMILQDMQKYRKHSPQQGLLICSGFFNDDKEMIMDEAGRNDFVYLFEKTMNKWSSLVFQKKTN
ncbi:MAG: 50S ribosomal protein L11 methyltransferase [Cyclobacteriaceae bacterium]|nr:50S ribosomal protein L11 methyltransferase [Cyclobacteriaceae bacterium]